MFYINIIKSYRDVVAICDSDILGGYFEEDTFQLDVKESFYKGKEVSEKELLEAIDKMSKEDATFNIIGKESVSCALKSGIINKEQIKQISGIPYVLVLL